MVGMAGRRWIAAIVAVLCAIQLVGCAAAVDAPAAPASAPVSSAAPTATTTSAGTSTPAGTPSASPTASAASLRPASRPVDERKGDALHKPFTVNGVVVVSAKHKVGAGYKPRLASDYPLERTAAKAFAKLQRAIRAKGLRLFVVSGYRSYATQSALYNSRLASMGRAWTQKFVAKPGTSEHQTGLALDLRSPTGRGTTFDNTKEWKWLRAHAQQSGFVLRYPEGKTKVTGIGFEPWHWRYVGVAQAKAIRALGDDITIEEYLRLA